MATAVQNNNMKVMVKDATTFEDMKIEFLLMDEEIKEKNTEIDELKKALLLAEEKLAERDDAAIRMVDQMEELHENLAELDVRFERSEDMNAILRDDKEDLKREFEKEINDHKSNLVATERRYASKIEELNTELTMMTKQKDYVIRGKCAEIEKLNYGKAAVENQLHEKDIELSKLKDDFQNYQKTSNEKMQQLQFTFKHSIETVLEPVVSYLEKNKGSKTPMKKTKGYRILKSAENDLKNLLSNSVNNNQ